MIGIAIVPVLVSLAALYRSLTSSYEDVAVQQLQHSVEQTATTIDEFIHTRAEDLRVFGLDPIFWQAGDTDISTYLSRRVAIFPSYRAFYHTDQHGTIVAASAPDAVGRSLLTLFPNLSDAFQKAARSRPDALFATELHDGSVEFLSGISDRAGNTDGVLVGQVDTHFLRGLIDRVDRRTPGQRLAVVSGDGKVALAGTPGSAPGNDQPSASLTALQDLAARQASGSVVYRNGDGRRMMAAFARLQRFGDDQPEGDLVVASGPYADLMAPLQSRFPTALALLGAVSTLAMIGALYVVIRRAQRLESLAQTARAFSDRDVAAADASPRDELGQVSDAFNDMAGRISARTAELAAENAARQRAQQELLTAHAELEQMLTHSPAIIYRLKVEGTGLVPLRSSGNMLRLLGYPPEDTLSFEWWQTHVHPDDLAVAMATIPETFERGSSRGEYRVRHCDGHYVWMEDDRRLVRDDSGQPIEMVGVWNDITERKVSDEKLRASEERLRDLFENSSDLIQSVAPDGTIVFVNRAWHETLGYSDADLAQLTIFDIVHPDSLDHCRAVFSRVVSGEHLAAEVAMRAKDGRTVLVEGNAHCQFKDGQPIATRAIFRDVTARALLEKELRAKNDNLAEQTRRAEEANRAKSEFLATMSHEIRTPMNGVIGMADLLLQTNLSPVQRDYAERVLTSAESLLTIINDILDFSKVESGKVILEHIDFVFGTLVEEAAALLAERAQSKGLEMACIIDPAIPETLGGDPGRLRQVVTNLLGNAIKFTPAGEVVLRAFLVEDGPADATIRIEVTDTGIGIAPDARERLFQSFSQADSSTTRKFGGTGLGLAISKRLVELMGGEIGVDSEPGKGSTFWIVAKFPRAQAQIPVPHPRPDLQGLRALAVDDNQTNLELVQAQTSSWGMTCDTASSGAQALRLIAAADQQPYDVGILDMQMPEMSGLQLAEAIRQNPANHRLKLILMTSVQESSGTAATGAVIEASLTKPVRRSQLYECLRTVLGDHTFRPPERESTPETVPQSAAADTVRKRRVLLAEDNQTNQLAARRMLQILGCDVQVVVNGLDAVKAYREGEFDVILMDNQMPEMDGFDATREIRKCERAEGRSPIPIIAVTANAMQGDRETCLAAGMNDYISKPFRVSQLKELLDRWCSRSAASVVPQVPARDPVLDSALLDEFRKVGPDGTFVNTIISQYLAESRSLLARVHDAIEHRDATALTASAHALTGCSSTIGAHLLAALCVELEGRGKAGALDDARGMVPGLDAELTRVWQALGSERRAVA